MKAERGVTFVELDAILQEPADESLPPEQESFDDLGEGLGVTYGLTEELRIGEKERLRDQHRWELNPQCAEDYISRTHTRGRVV